MLILTESRIALLPSVHGVTYHYTMPSEYNGFIGVLDLVYTKCNSNSTSSTKIIIRAIKSIF